MTGNVLWPKTRKLADSYCQNEDGQKWDKCCSINEAFFFNSTEDFHLKINSHGFYNQYKSTIIFTVRIFIYFLLFWFVFLSTPHN